MDQKPVPYRQGLQEQSPAKALTRHQKATLYFKALRGVKSLFESVGFREAAIPRTTGFTIEMDEFVLEMEAKESPMVAHVTSYPGYEFDPKKINAKVTMLSPARRGEYVIQVIATTSDQMTQMPVYAIISEDSKDPLREAFINALMCARDLMRKEPAVLAKIQEALRKKDIEGELEKLRAEETTKQLGTP